MLCFPLLIIDREFVNSYLITEKQNNDACMTIDNHLQTVAGLYQGVANVDGLQNFLFPAFNAIYWTKADR